MSSPDFCLRSLSEIPGRKMFSEVLLHLRSHHRGCGRTKRCFTASGCPIALNRPGSVEIGQDMLHKRCLHGGKITVLRTVCVAQPRLWAISEGRCPRLEANTIWLRRRVKALGERSPASSPACSAGLKAPTYMGAFMPSVYYFPSHCTRNREH
jgi:hypothetical protein